MNIHDKYRGWTDEQLAARISRISDTDHLEREAFYIFKEAAQRFACTIQTNSENEKRYILTEHWEAKKRAGNVCATKNSVFVIDSIGDIWFEHTGGMLPSDLAEEFLADAKYRELPGYIQAKDPSVDRCVMCGEEVPEGTMICPSCAVNN